MSEALRLLGHDGIEQRLYDQFTNKNLPHAMLFCGAKGIGKASMAMRLAKFLAVGELAEQGGVNLFGEPEVPKHPLDVDAHSTAAGRIDNGSHGDVMLIRPQWDERKKAYKKDILVEDVRKVGHFLSHTPSECDHRIVVIDSADALNTAAANALLKVLEEPPENAILICVAHKPGSILDTIRSRCRPIYFSPPSKAEFHTILSEQGVEEGLIDPLYSFADGSPGFALELVEEGALEMYQRQCEVAIQGAGDNQSKFFDFVTSKQKPERWLVFQHCWMRLLSRIQQAPIAALDGELFAQEKTTLAQMATKLQPDAWHTLWEDSQRLFSRTNDVYLDPKLSLQQLFAALGGQAIRI